MFACSCWKIPNSEGAAGETSPSLEQDYFLKLYWLKKNSKYGVENVYLVFWSLGTARFVTPFFSCLELTSQMRGAHKQTTKSKDPAAWKAKYFPFLCFEVASAKWRTKVRRRKKLFFSLGRSGSKNKWKTSPAWRWGEKGFTGVLMHLWCKKSKLWRRYKERLQKTSHFPHNLGSIAPSKGFSSLVLNNSSQGDPGSIQGKIPTVLRDTI